MKKHVTRILMSPRTIRCTGTFTANSIVLTTFVSPLTNEVQAKWKGRVEERIECILGGYTWHPSCWAGLRPTITSQTSLHQLKEIIVFMRDAGLEVILITHRRRLGKWEEGNIEHTNPCGDQRQTAELGELLNPVSMTHLRV